MTACFLKDPREHNLIDMNLSIPFVLYHIQDWRVELPTVRPDRGEKHQIRWNEGDFFINHLTTCTCYDVTWRTCHDIGLHKD